MKPRPSELYRKTLSQGEKSRLKKNPQRKKISKEESFPSSCWSRSPEATTVCPCEQSVSVCLWYTVGASAAGRFGHPWIPPHPISSALRAGHTGFLKLPPAWHVPVRNWCPNFCIKGPLPQTLIYSTLPSQCLTKLAHQQPRAFSPPQPLPLTPLPLSNPSDPPLLHLNLANQDRLWAFKFSQWI